MVPPPVPPPLPPPPPVPPPAATPPPEPPPEPPSGLVLVPQLQPTSRIRTARSTRKRMVMPFLGCCRPGGAHSVKRCGPAKAHRVPRHVTWPAHGASFRTVGG